MHRETLEYFDGQQKLLGELFYDETRLGPGGRSPMSVRRFWYSPLLKDVVILHWQSHKNWQNRVI